MDICAEKRPEEMDVTKESFFSSDSDDKRDPSTKETTGEDKVEKEFSDEENRELEKLLRMTEINPSTRSEADKEEGEGKKKTTAKVKEDEVSLLDCLNAPEETDSGPAHEPEMDTNKSETDILTAMNEHIKHTFLMSSEESSNQSIESGCETEKDPKREKKQAKVSEKPTESSKKKDELSAFRFSGYETSEKEESKKDDSSSWKNNTSHGSSSSVEYVEQVQKGKTKAAASGEGSKSSPTSDTDSGSDIQQVYCKSNSSPIKGRKNINKILKKESLQVETKQALRMETERKKRVNEREKLFEKLFPEGNAGPKLVLDFDPVTKEELVVVDSSLARQLKPHQKAGVRFMWNCCFESLKRLEEDSGSGCVLAHCMGLGKTLQVITLVHTVITQNTGVQTVMVMCPLNTLRNWCHEFRMWLKDCRKKIRPVDLIPCKTKHSRMEKVRTWVREGGVLLISYEMFRSLIKKDNQGASFAEGFLDPGPDLVVCDEGHVLKNSSSALSKYISRIKTLRRIILTGTPLQNNLIEYYCMVQFVKPNILGTKKEFLNRFVNPINNGQFEDSTQLDVRLMKRRAHVLHTMLDGFIQRFGYYVLTPFLPEKHEYVISIALTEAQEKIYRLFISRCTQEGRGLLRDFHWMQRVWTHPRVMLMHAIKNPAEDSRADWEALVQDEDYNSVQSSGKLVLLFKILKRCKEIGDKVLVFSQSLYSLDLIEFFLRKANRCYSSGVQVDFADSWVPGQDYFRLDGSTSSDNRDVYCQHFNAIEDERARLFLISTKAGGLGINLVAANRVVVFDASWNPTHDAQSIFRVYRFGQKKVCYIYRFLAAATMEEKIYRRQVTKQSLALRILDEQQIERHYTMGNLLELYRYDPVPKTEWKIPKIPKDNLFAEILASNRDIIVGYHEHDSLLENKEEEELTEEERRAAWDDYEKEKLIPEQTRYLPNGNLKTFNATIPRVYTNRISNEGLRTVNIYTTGPNALINQTENDMCKIVEVRTLNDEASSVGGIGVERLLEFGETLGLKQNEGEGFGKYCQRIQKAVETVFPWGVSGTLVRGEAPNLN